jgi:dipeptidase
MPLLSCLVFTLAGTASACTSLLIGPDATATGEPIVAQSDDGEGAGDPRLVYVPPLDWPANSPRPVIDYGDFPRYIGTERRVPAYFPTAKLPNVTNNLLGHIPQVNHTFGYWEGDYAISNEHGVSFGESTCSARTYALPVSRGGTSTALLTMNELSRLAAERAKTVPGLSLESGDPRAPPTTTYSRGGSGDR